MTSEKIFLLAYIFFGIEVALCLHRAFNKSLRWYAKAFWFTLSIVGVAGFTTAYAMSR